MDKKLNIVIPMAGRGSRFADIGYKTPKPLIPVHGKKMIEVVVNNLTPKREHQFIFICQNSHIKQYNLEQELSKLAKNTTIIGIDGITDGMACSVLKAKNIIDNNTPLMTANSDQFIDFDINEYLNISDERNLDGLIMTMTSNDKKWSFAKVNKEGYVIETAEKQVISDEATVGIYNFKKGSDFVKYAEKMIQDNVRANNEFYLCPVYNYLIKNNKKIGIYNIGREYDGMYGLGTPKDLEFFLKHSISQKIKE